ncbi:hypothetical protein D3C72_2019850 [compost metagenome]
MHSRLQVLDQTTNLARDSRIVLGRLANFAHLAQGILHCMTFGLSLRHHTRQHTQAAFHLTALALGRSLRGLTTLR